MRLSSSFFFFNYTATTEIYTLSLHDALPISWQLRVRHQQDPAPERSAEHSSVSVAHRPHHNGEQCLFRLCGGDRKSTRLNSSHVSISYAVFCLKKKKQKIKTQNTQTYQ